MLIKKKEHTLVWEHPSGRELGNLAAAWPNGAGNGSGGTRREAQRRALMSPADLCGRRDE